MLRLLSFLALVFPGEAFSNPLNSINKQTGELGITLFTTPFFVKSIQEQTSESFSSFANYQKCNCPPFSHFRLLLFRMRSTDETSSMGQSKQEPPWRLVY